MNWEEFTAWAEEFIPDLTPSQAQLDRMRRMLGDVVLGAPTMTREVFEGSYWAPYQHLPMPPEGLFTALGIMDRKTIK